MPIHPMGISLSTYDVSLMVALTGRLHPLGTMNAIRKKKPTYPVVVEIFQFGTKVETS